MDTAYIVKYIEDLLLIMNIVADVNVVDDEDIHMTVFAIETKEPNLLIGHRGENLSAFSHLIKKISDRKLEDKKDKKSFIVDVNNYQSKHINELKNKSSILAERARYFKSVVDMEPMSPYERMIVHSIFTYTDDIDTESAGEGLKRHIVLRFKDSEI